MAIDKKIFLRNDDVRNVLDKELTDLTQLCISHKVPISHAVEPANVSDEVINWLLTLKMKHPTLIEIIQHGYNHNLTHPEVKMEFGGNRNYVDQLNDIVKGKKLMDQYFGDYWSPVFTFPYGSYNYYTLKAVEKAGYNAISSKIDFSTKNQIKNKIGTMLNKDFLYNKKISYHNSQRKKFTFKEFSISVNLIKKYIDSNTAHHYSIDEIYSQVLKAEKHTNTIGILFHHRFHKNEMLMIDNLITKLKDKQFTFSTIMKLIC